MYPYNNYNNYNSSDNGGQTPYGPLTPQQRVPDENGSYHFTPQPPEEQKPKRKKPRRFARYVAGAAAVIVMSAAAGGGAATWVLNNQAPQQPASSTQTVFQSTNAAAASPVEDGSVAAVAQKAADSVVEIDTKATQEGLFFGNQLVAGSGSGVIISEDGYIVTNNHVVESSDSIVVRLSDGTEYDAKLIGTDQQTDLAVVKIEAVGLTATTYADSDNIQVGDLAVAIGNPLGELGGTVTSGIISATGREVNIDGGTMTLLQTNAAINPGNSGGGLFDGNGNLIGIVNAKSAGVEIEGLGFAIPSNTVQKVVPDIIEKGYVTGRPEMGIQVVTIDDARTAMMYGVTKAGIYVADPGRNENLQAGDRFVFIDGESVDSSNVISNVLRRHAVGDTIEVTVERGGKEVKTQVTLRERQPVAEPESEPELPSEL